MYIGTYMRTYRHTHIYIYTHTYTSLCSKVSGSKNTELSVSILSASPLKGGFWSWPQKTVCIVAPPAKLGKNVVARVAAAVTGTAIAKEPLQPNTEISSSDD